MYSLTLVTDCSSRTVLLADLTAESLASATQELGLVLTDIYGTARRIAESYLDSRRVEGRAILDNGVLVVHGLSLDGNGSATGR